MDRYLRGLLDPVVTLLELHKLMYFLQEGGEPLKLKYEYGPYASNLRQVLIKLDTHYTQGYGAGDDSPTKPIHLLPGAVEAASAFIRESPDTRGRMDRVAALIDGFEDPYGLELLSTVHWVTHGTPATREDAIAAVQQWSPRKKEHLKREHLLKAWQRLKDQGWIPNEV